MKEQKNKTVYGIIIGRRNVRRALLALEIGGIDRENVSARISSSYCKKDLIKKSEKHTKTQKICSKLEFLSSLFKVKKIFQFLCSFYEEYFWDGRIIVEVKVNDSEERFVKDTFFKEGAYNINVESPIQELYLDNRKREVLYQNCVFWKNRIPGEKLHREYSKAS